MRTVIESAASNRGFTVDSYLFLTSGSKSILDAPGSIRVFVCLGYIRSLAMLAMFCPTLSSVTGMLPTLELEGSLGCGGKTTV